MEAARRAPGTSRKLDETYIQGLLGLRSACFFSFFDSLSIIIIRPISFFLPLAQAWPGETILCFVFLCGLFLACLLKASVHDPGTQARPTLSCFTPRSSLLWCGHPTSPRSANPYFSSRSTPVHDCNQVIYPHRLLLHLLLPSHKGYSYRSFYTCQDICFLLSCTANCRPLPHILSLHPHQFSPLSPAHVTCPWVCCV